MVTVYTEINLRGKIIDANECARARDETLNLRITSHAAHNERCTLGKHVDGSCFPLGELIAPFDSLSRVSLAVVRETAVASGTLASRPFYVEKSCSSLVFRANEPRLEVTPTRAVYIHTRGMCTGGSLKSLDIF